MDDPKTCCCLCQSDCSWPWLKDKPPPEVNVEVDYHFRGRIDSTNSLGQTESPILVPVITEQPQPDIIEVVEKPKKHKKSVSSLDSAIFSSASGILNQVLLERVGPKRSEGPQAMLSLKSDEATQRICIDLISLKNYNSMFLLKPSLNLVRSGSDSSNASPSLVVRICLQPSGNQTVFTSVNSRSKNPVWKEKLNFDLDSSEKGEQKLDLVLYESNRFSRWTPVKMASHSLRDVLHSGNHNLSFELEPLNQDVQSYGEIMLSFCYNKASTRVFCDIIEIRSLLHFGLNKRAEYFIKIQFFDKKKLIKMKKTSAGKPEPTSVLTINETFRVKVPVANLNNLNLKISVCDAKLIIGDSSLYFLNFGQEMGVGPREFTYWSDFIRDIPASGKKQWFSLLQK